MRLRKTATMKDTEELGLDGEEEEAEGEEEEEEVNEEGIARLGEKEFAQYVSQSIVDIGGQRR
jgi:hypothetical protein